MTPLCVGLVFAYRLLVRPWLPRRCLFATSCSEFVLQGLRAGGWREGWRRFRARRRWCRPLEHAAWMLDDAGHPRLLASPFPAEVGAPHPELASFLAERHVLVPFPRGG